VRKVGSYFPVFLSFSSLLPARLAYVFGYWKMRQVSSAGSRTFCNKNDVWS